MDRKDKRGERGETNMWIQIYAIADVIKVARSRHPGVLVAQGADVGGYGLAQGAGIVTLLPGWANSSRDVGTGSIPLVAAM